MAAITQNELVTATYKKLQDTKSTINTTDFTLVGTPAAEASAASFPNGRSEKFFDLNGTDMAYTFNGSGVNVNNHIIHCWVRPDFTQTIAADPMVCSGYTIATGLGVQFYLNNAQDDWSFDQYTTGYSGQLQSAGTTFAVNDVIHLAVLCSNNGIDGGVKKALYINGSLAASDNGSIGSGVWSSTSAVGKNNVAATAWFDGGVYDFALLDYDTLAASHTDAEIIAALYSNSLNAGAHLFLCEVTNQNATPGMTINANKLRINTNTASSSALALTLGNDLSATFTGIVKAAGYKSSDNSAGLTTTITTAKLTTGGANGSMVFKNGLLTSSTPAT